MTHDPGPAFRALHSPGDPFILANAWDAGSARVLAALGAQAIGTTSAGHAFTLGRPDMGHVSRDEAMDHAQSLVAATDLPVSGDLENGYGDAPETVAETIRLAAEAGLAGCSIEDTALPGSGAYPRDLAVERIRAAAAAARSLSRDFVLVARADGVLNESYDMKEALARVTAYADAGADCVYVPLPPSMEDLARICAAVPVPVNALAAGRFLDVSRQAFAEAGVARISVGSMLAHTAAHALVEAAGAMLDHGDFSKMKRAQGLDALLLKGAGRG
ncbi:isocitrate lyase/PEP mutase family protein [Oceanibium sediminis]|uniref:isocitrate lyase/PEP mutase family protein n=1 Tax=Oceanibium sediminis TaxID=2026339 RepID=UPI000DD2FFF0|nr:isocitrate lyase/phosphoenolpyruvate mutase family protein [Oceanibium sediminis]